MHQQDLSRDDMLEALLEILNKMKEYIFERKKEGENNQKELNDESKLDKFHKIMDFVKEQNVSPEVNQLVDNMKQNPERSMELLNEIVKAKIGNNLDVAKEKVTSLNVENPKELNMSSQDIELLKNIKNEFVTKVDELINKYNDVTNSKDQQEQEQKNEMDEKEQSSEERVVEEVTLEMER